MSMIPKTWAAFTDAIDEGAGFSANKAIGIVLESNLSKLAANLDKGGLLDQEKKRREYEAEYSRVQAQIEEVIDREVTNAVCERFAFIEPKEE